MINTIEHINYLQKTAEYSGFAVALPKEFFGKNRFMRERILIDAESTLIEYYGGIN